MSNIVIIEDDDLMRGLLAEWLRDAGYRVTEPGGLGGGADLVIVDLYLPRHTGIEKVCAAKEAHPGAAVIAMSGQFRAGLAGACAAAQALGAQRVVAKPFTRDELLGAVRAVIGSAA